MQVRVLARVELAPVRRNVDNSIVKCKPSRGFLCKSSTLVVNRWSLYSKEPENMHACKTQLQMSVWRQHRHAIAFLFRNRCLADAHVNFARALIETVQLPFRHREHRSGASSCLVAGGAVHAGILFGLEYSPSPFRPLPRPLQRQHVSCTCTHIGLRYACIGASPGRSIFLRCYISVRRSMIWSSKLAPAALHVWKLKKAMTRFYE
jgi:hypothetical protein